MSFIIHNSMNLYEHRSTMNPNMPLRGLFYFSSLYKKLAEDSLDIYSKKLVKLPTPQYIVFLQWCRRLAGLYGTQTIGCVYGKRFQYIQFHGKKEMQCQGYQMEDAIEMAVRYCMEHDILKQILMENRSAFMDNILTTYDAEKHMKLIARENYEEGFEDGFENGLSDGQNQVN